MKIQSIALHPLHIPFKVRFRHSSADRSVTQSVLAIAETDRGYRGMGEGCPREYVTDENVKSSIRFIKKYEEKLRNQINSVGDLQQWVGDREVDIDANPAAWCAVELAILDALAKENSESVEQALGLPEVTGSFNYTAVLGDSEIKMFVPQVARYAGFGFTDFKVKISGDPVVDNQKFAIVRDAVPEAQLRLDANNLWRDPKCALNYLKQVEGSLFALEEPLQAMEYDGLQEIARVTEIPIILDESFLNRHHFARISEDVDAFIINLRVSKMGGLIRSMQIAREAAETGISLVVGAQVGETSILTRAALTVVNTYPDNVLAQEGAFGTLLLEQDVVEKPLMFGKKGQLDPSRLLDPSVYGWQMGYDFADEPT